MAHLASAPAQPNPQSPPLTRGPYPSAAHRSRSDLLCLTVVWAGLAVPCVSRPFLCAWTRDVRLAPFLRPRDPGELHPCAILGIGSRRIELTPVRPQGITLGLCGSFCIVAGPVCLLNPLPTERRQIHRREDRPMLQLRRKIRGCGLTGLTPPPGPGTKGDPCTSTFSCPHCSQPPVTAC